MQDEFLDNNYFMYIGVSLIEAEIIVMGIIS